MTQHIDLEEAQRFLTWLDPQAERFTFQTFSDGGKDAHLAKVHHLQPDQLGPLVRLNGQGAGVFVTVNATDLQGRRKANMQRVRAVWLDLDGAPLGPVQACPLPPHVVIESSPERYHAYWRVENGVSLEEAETLVAGIAANFDGDPAVKDCGRVMRLPGFYHQKHEPFRSRILHLDDQVPLSVAQVRQHLVNGAVFETCSGISFEPRTPEELKAADIDEIEAAIRTIPNAGERFASRKAWIDMGHAIKAACLDDPGRGLAIFLAWSSRWEGWDGDADYVIRQYASFKPTRLGAEYVLDVAASYGFEPKVRDFEALDDPDDEPALPSITGIRGTTLDPKDPYGNARLWFRQSHVWNDVPILLRSAGDFRRWDGRHWPVEDLDYLRKHAWRFLADGQKWQKVKPGRAPGRKMDAKPNGEAASGFELVPFEPKPADVNALIDALAGHAQIRGGLVPQCWLDHAGEQPPAVEIAILLVNRTGVEAEANLAVVASYQVQKQVEVCAAQCHQIGFRPRHLA